MGPIQKVFEYSQFDWHYTRWRQRQSLTTAHLLNYIDFFYHIQYQKVPSKHSRSYWDRDFLMVSRKSIFSQTRNIDEFTPTREMGSYLVEKNMAYLQTYPWNVIVLTYKESFDKHPSQIDCQRFEHKGTNSIELFPIS